LSFVLASLARWLLGLGWAGLGVWLALFAGRASAKFHT
jgi:hypothetical protein